MVQDDMLQYGGGKKDGGGETVVPTDKDVGGDPEDASDKSKLDEGTDGSMKGDKMTVKVTVKKMRCGNNWLVKEVRIIYLNRLKRVIFTGQIKNPNVVNNSY